MKKYKATLKLLFLFLFITIFFGIIFYLSPATIAVE